MNRSGHKLPTSYPSRRVWLDLRVANPNGRVIFESGRLNADGSIAGADGDTDPGAFEPHHQTIIDANQVQIYEPVMGNTDKAVTFTLLRASHYVKDNRLTPAGFSKSQVPNDVKVSGAAADDDPDFDDGSDLVTYRIPVCSRQKLEVTATLNYRALSYPSLRDLFHGRCAPRGGALQTALCRPGGSSSFHFRNALKLIAVCLI